MEEDRGPPASLVKELGRLDTPGLEAVACDGQGCAWYSGDTRHDLALPEAGVPAPSPVDPGGVGTAQGMPEPPKRSMDAWALAASMGRRLPFAREIPLDGAVLTYVRGMDARSATLVRAGKGYRQVRAPGTESPISCTAWLSGRGDGQEAYLLVWPSPTLLAFRPDTLQTLWTLPLGGPSLGHFVDPEGRFLVVSQTAPPTGERWLDYEWDLLKAADADPASDEGIRGRDVPPGIQVMLVDLQSREVALQARGTYRALLEPRKGLVLLASTEELVVASWPVPPEKSGS